MTPDNKSRGKRPAQQQQQQQQPLVDLDSDEDQQDDEMRPTTSYGALETTADGAARDGAQSERLAVPPSPFRSAILPSRQPHSAAADSGLTDNQGGASRPGSSKKRQMSFKRRAPSTAGESQRSKSLLHRSIETFTGRSRASSDARSPGKGVRRIPTISTHYANTEGGKPRIPSIMPSTQPSPHSTPIPTLPFVVLCLVCFGEFSSSGVAGPFLFFLIESFKVGGESEVGFWAGIAGEQS